jgi:hypothetical protein
LRRPHGCRRCVAFSGLVMRHLNCLSANSRARPLGSSPTEPHPAPHSWRRRDEIVIPTLWFGRPGALPATGLHTTRSEPRPVPSSYARAGHTPPINVRRCGRQGLRGNPPSAGPPLRFGPWRDASVAWDASGLSPPRYAHAGGGLASTGTTKGPVSWLPSDP